MRITVVEEIAEKLLVLVVRHYRVLSPVEHVRRKLSLHVSTLIPYPRQVLRPPLVTGK
jgi:hypothetical protein